jgi:hypothetical protein
MPLVLGHADRDAGIPARVDITPSLVRFPSLLMALVETEVNDAKRGD